MTKPYERYEVYFGDIIRETMARSEKEAINRAKYQLGLAGTYEYDEWECTNIINLDRKEREEKIKMNLGFDVNDWNEAEAIEMGEFETLELGGHEIIIKKAYLYTGQSGNTSLKLEVDIAGNDKQAGFFQKQYDNNPLAERKWPSGAVRYLSLKKESLGYTKGTITALEKSNNGFKFDTSKGWEQLEGLKCAGVFGLEQYENSEGKLKMATKLIQIRSLEKINEIKIPNVKLLNGSSIPYEEYLKNSSSYNTQTIENTYGEDVQIDDNFLDD